MPGTCCGVRIITEVMRVIENLHLFNASLTGLKFNQCYNGTLMSLKISYTCGHIS